MSASLGSSLAIAQTPDKSIEKNIETPSKHTQKCDTADGPAAACKAPAVPAAACPAPSGTVEDKWKKGRLLQVYNLLNPVPVPTALPIGTVPDILRSQLLAEVAYNQHRQITMIGGCDPEDTSVDDRLAASSLTFARPRQIREGQGDEGRRSVPGVAL